MNEQRYNDEVYKDHAIRVLAERFDASSEWTVEVHIQTPDGTHLPAIEDKDRSYPVLEVAFATGSQTGRNVVDSQ